MEISHASNLLYSNELLKTQIPKGNYQYFQIASKLAEERAFEWEVRIIDADKRVENLR